MLEHSSETDKLKLVWHWYYFNPLFWAYIITACILLGLVIGFMQESRDFLSDLLIEAFTGVK